MSAIINPGSHIAQPGEGWSNTFAKAHAEARDWLRRMHADGMTDVELLDESTERDGRWVFTYRHAVTAARVQLETHGIDDIDAYTRLHLFTPRVYWNGSSSATPELEDFAAPGFTAVRTYAPESPDRESGR